ncbi:MAG: hypothetical protein IPN17_30010 [Deltaproteobacteria bacterium]|nr:hypothetical protein [Deltaproteobacteria bacterium]MBK8696391.1 hypothetical protein [Deltaproteobacteria bacterium]MBP6832056.1 hypothetical protein [Deltaproteobacteria bacterium]
MTKEDKAKAKFDEIVSNAKGPWKDILLDLHELLSREVPGLVEPDAEGVAVGFKVTPPFWGKSIRLLDLRSGGVQPSPTYLRDLADTLADQPVRSAAVRAVHGQYVRRLNRMFDQRYYYDTSNSWVDAPSPLNSTARRRALVDAILEAARALIEIP